MNLARMTAAVLLCCSTASAAAETLFGFYAGAGTWQQTYSGDVTSGITTVDVEQDLGLDDDNNNVFYFALEHGVPALPNVRVQHFSLDVDGSNLLSRSIEFNGQVFNLADTVNTTIDLSQTDAVLYYEVVDSVVSLDLGITIAQLDGEFSVVSSLERATADFDEVIPMLYTKVRADLPLTGLWLGAEAQGVTFDDNTLLEYNAQVGWESEIGLGVEAGWRAVQLEIDSFDDVESAELDISGPYAAINFHF